MKGDRRTAKISPVQARLRVLDALYRDRGVRFRLTFDEEVDEDDVETQELEIVELLPAE
jgi:hypothetical protein